VVALALYDSGAYSFFSRTGFADAAEPKPAK